MYGALAELPCVIRGYLDTQARGQKACEAIINHIVLPTLAAGCIAEAAVKLRGAIAVARGDPEHRKVVNTLLHSIDLTNEAESVEAGYAD